ncbi:MULTISPECIES: type 4a pilus biogenesis protein PilO [Methylotenera]|uniref:type 4a pilus biogenesis protein PilO n=1 Tax=Methylotenera TaxID=359407 RepID=UPI0003688EB2|nr:MULTISPECIES: type 4a pilus biogenesis protein PilO [Methylotenera]
MVKPVFSKQSKLHDSLHYRLRKLGWQGIFGLIFIAISILLLIFVLVPNTKKMDALNLSFVELKANKAKGKVEIKPDSQLDVIAKLNGLMPKQNEANNKIAQILHAATEVGLATDKVDYASQPYSPALIKVQIKFPTQGSYIQIRQFINAVLNALPTLALADIKLKREDIGRDSIDANIQFNLYVSKNANVLEKMSAN